MSALLKWIAAGLVAGILWLVGMYTEEYFRPYKQIRTGLRKKWARSKPRHGMVYGITDLRSVLLEGERDEQRWTPALSISVHLTKTTRSTKNFRGETASEVNC